MATDFVHAIFKRGDKIPQVKANEHFAIRNGMLVDWIDPEVYDPKLSAWMQRVYLCAKVKRDLSPRLIAGVQENQDSVDGVVDKRTYMARTAAIDVAELEKIASLTGVADDMASRQQSGPFLNRYKHHQMYMPHNKR